MVRAILIDNNPSFLRELENIIRSRFSFIEMISARNGKEAIEEIETSPPDICLVHVNLPGENSFELVRKIKSRYPKVFISIVSSYDWPEYRDAAYRNGADHFILKDAPIEDYYSLFETILPEKGLCAEAAAGRDETPEKPLPSRRSPAD